MIEHESKELFNKRSVDKQFYIKYGNGTITNLELRQESFTLTETLCSEPELTFGCCEASSISFLVSRVFTALKNDLLDVSVVLDRNAENPFKIGKYKVYSSVPTADRKEKEVLAYDAMYDVINADVATWYNTILPNADSSVTLREFRSSFFDCFGIEQVEITLPNDDMVVKKTVQTDKLSGKDVVTAICEVNGCFGHINRDGKMDYVFLKERIDAIYPSDDLFPSEDLYPSGNNYETFNTGNYYGCQYEDYVVKKIDALEIREQENSLGISVGDGNNRYIINGNMLLLGKAEEELTVIAQKIFDVIKHIEYRPFEATMRANLCRELGDLVRFNTKYDIFYSYILERRVTGIQNLIDTMSANGEEYRTAQVNNLQSDVLQLRGKTNVLERNIDETRSEITKVETKANQYTDGKLLDYSTTEQMNSVISQTADNITAEVSKTYTTKEETTKLSSRIDTTAESIESEVKRATKAEGELSTKITQTADMIAIGIDENGNLVTDLTVDKNGMTFVGNYLVINTKNLQLDEDGAEFSGVVSADDFTAYNAMYMQYKYGSTYGSKIKVFNMISSQSPAMLEIGEQGGALKELDIYPQTEFMENVDMLKNLDVFGDIVSYSTISTDAVSMGVKRIRPTADNASSNGSSDYRWTAIYATDGTINTSDRNKKTDIEEIGEKYEELYGKLKPVVYRFKDGVRLHTGFVSQDIEESLEEVGLTALEFAGFCKDHRRKITKVDGKEVEELLYDDDGNPIYDYSIRPAEFISLNTHMIQKAYKIIEQQQSEIDKLKQSVSFLLEKLGGMADE